MGKSSKKSAAPAVVAADPPAGVAPDAPAAVALAATVPKVKPSRKREAEEEIEKAASAKKQKPAPANAVPVPKRKKDKKPKKLEIARSDQGSSESEEVKVQLKKAAKPIKYESTGENTYDSKGQAIMAKTLALGNLPYAADEEDVKQFFSAVAKPVSVRLIKHDDGHPVGFAYVKFSTVEDAEKALVLNEEKLMDRAVRVDRAVENSTSASVIRDDESVGKPSGGSSFSVYVNGLDKSKQKDDMEPALYKHFSKCGEITRVYVPIDPESGKIKGIAFVDFSEKSSVKEALDLSRSSLGGFVLHVEEAKPKPAGGGWSGGRGSASRGRRGAGRAFQSRQSAVTATAGKRIRFDND